MWKALVYAREVCTRSWHKPFNLEDIIFMAYLIEPEENIYGIRNGGVTVGGRPKMDHRNVPRALTNLIEAAQEDRVEADEFYHEFEEIHPFFDGNGRTGSILWNWQRDTLYAQEDPPDFWGFYKATGIPRFTRGETFA